MHPEARRRHALQPPSRLLAILVLAACGEDVASAGPPEQATATDAATSDAICEGRACLACFGVEAGTPCDDDDPCTVDDQCVGGSCEGAETCACRQDKDCAGQEDGDLCNGTLYCAKKTMPWSCSVNPITVVECDEAGACETAACQPTTGSCQKLPKAKGIPCDDGVPCTDSACDGGGDCAVTDTTCQCLTGSDCMALEDGNVCNGTLYCDQSAEPWSCKVNQGSVVTCAASEVPCRTTACAPKTGACVETVDPDLVPCSDGEDCTVGDVCKSGTCSPGKTTCPCVSNAECVDDDDGDLCNGVPYCNKSNGKCEPNPASVITCPATANDACAVTQCQPKTGACVVLSINESGSCDDGNACTSGESCAKGVCAGGTKTCDCTEDADCKSNEDGNVCNGTLYCHLGTNKCTLNPATVVTCPTVDDSECKKSTCDKTTGGCAMKLAVDGAVCNDGNACTIGDTCKAGLCLAGDKKICPCALDSDCSKFEDGDFCNGTLYCDKSGQLPKCAINPATLISCNTAFDSACKKTVCVKQSGACVKVQGENGILCDDGDPCTSKDGCADGLCQGIAVLCDDGDVCSDDSCITKEGGCVHSAKACADDNPCTNDGCDPSSGLCAHPPNSSPCDDGNACTEADQCAAGACKGKGLNCDDGNACTKDACQKDGGCAHQPLNASSCSDADACTTDACSEGSCVGLPKPATGCDDGVLCTADLCHPAAGCLHLQADGLPCDDGDPCTTLDACDGGNCHGKAGASGCDDGNPCTSDGCKSGVGCTHLPAQGACDDGDPCTGAGACKQGKCAPGKDLGCTCKSTADCLGWEDGNVCNGTLVCDTSELPYVCKLDPKTVVTCEPIKDPCAKTSCNTSTGNCDVAKAADGTGCTPQGKACLKGVCADGLCASEGSVNCDDANGCTLDLCKNDAGCVHDSSAVAGKPCDDGDPCSKGEACKGGACAGGDPVGCDDGNACTLDLCDGKLGCQNHVDLLDGKACDDANACTSGETCKGKGCGGGAAVPCDDGKTCTDDVCDSGKGCQHTANAQLCDDADKCTDADVCKDGACNGAKIKCGDGNPCTVDFCDPSQGCAYDSGPLEGKPCVHPSGCVIGAFCNQGGCAGGDASACDNTGDCKIQGDSLFVSLGPTLGGATVRIADDGSAWAVSFTGSNGGWLAVRYDEFGAPLVIAKTTEPGKAVELRSVLPLSDGGAFIGGGINHVSAQSWTTWTTRLRRIDKDGKTLWTNKSGTTPGVIQDIIRQKSGDYVFAANIDGNGNSHYQVFSPSGSMLKHTKYKGAKYTYYIDMYTIVGLTPEPTGGFYSFGRLVRPSWDTKQYGVFLLTRHDANATRLWERSVKTGYMSMPYDMAISAGGELMLVGYRQLQAGGAHVPWLARFSKGGTQLGSTAFLAGGYARVLTNVVATADGGLLMGSHGKAKQADPGWRAELTHLDASLNVVWKRDWSPQDSASMGVGSLTAVPKGGWRFGGNSATIAASGNVTSTMLVRTDAWGNSPCKTVGKCKGLKAGDCDDKDACTNDFCEPATGCAHAAVKGCP